MKKRFFSLVLSVVLAGTLMVGCSQGSNSPVTTVTQMVDSVFYLKDTDGAYDNLGMTSQELRDVFTGMAEQILQSQFYPEEEAAEEEATEEETTAEGTEEAEEETAVEIRPEVREMAQKLLSAMQTVNKYETKLMTQSSTQAQVRLTLYPMDLTAYYTDYFNISNNMPLEPENPTEEEQAEIDQQWKQAYLDSLDSVKTSTEPLEMTVQLYKRDGKWLIQDMEQIISDLFYIYAGMY